MIEMTATVTMKGVLATALMKTTVMMTVMVVGATMVAGALTKTLTNGITAVGPHPHWMSMGVSLNNTRKMVSQLLLL